MNTETLTPGGFRSLTPGELDAVSGGFTFVSLSSSGTVSVFGGGYGDKSLSSDPFKSLVKLYTVEGQAQLAALVAWLEAGAPFPELNLEGVELVPNDTPIPSAPPTAGSDNPPSDNPGSGYQGTDGLDTDLQ